LASNEAGWQVLLALTSPTQPIPNLLKEKGTDHVRLGFNFAMLRNYYEGQLIKHAPVLESLDLAMEVLFSYSEFHDASFDLFIRLTEGKLSREEEQMLNALGIKTF